MGWRLEAFLSFRPFTYYTASINTKTPGLPDAFVAGAVGIEPTQTVLETVVLPLYEAPMGPIYYNKPRMGRGFLLRFLVHRDLLAKLAILFDLQACGSVFLVFGCSVVEVMAYGTFQINPGILRHCSYLS